MEEPCVEFAEDVIQTDRLGVEIAQWRDVHRKSVEWNNSVGRINNSVLIQSEFS